MKILLIAPDCYPVDGAESIVNIKLLQAFSRFDDVTIDLVSRKHSVVTYPSADISQYGVRVNNLHIVESCNRLNIKTAWQTLMCFVYFGSAFKGSVWAYEALPVIKKLLKNNQYDYVLTKSSPSFLLGSFCHKKGFKWVASWNDPFPSKYYPAPYGDGNNHKPSMLESLMLGRMRMADYHVFPSRQLLEHMERYLHFSKNNAMVIPHAVIQQNNCNLVRKKDGILRIIHSGNLRGARNPHSFFRAVDALLYERPEISIEVTILGDVAQEYRPDKDKYPNLINCFNFIPPVEYTKALKALKDYSIACIIEAPCNEGEAVFLPTKVTDFMQEGIPIMAISPKGGVLQELYNNGNIGYFGDVSDDDSIKQAILKAWNDYNDKGLKQNVIDDRFTPQSIVDAYRSISTQCNCSVNPVIAV